MTRDQTNAMLAAAKRKLTDAGWEHAASVMHDGPGYRYGSLFTHVDHPRESIYVNVDTAPIILDVAYRGHVRGAANVPLRFDPAVFTHCPCESGLCDHERSCSRPLDMDADGTTRSAMVFLGPCCRQCADNMVASGGAQYVMVPIGTCTEYVG
jgi:hypothetical protein